MRNYLVLINLGRPILPIESTHPGSWGDTVGLNKWKPNTRTHHPLLPDCGAVWQPLHASVAVCRTLKLRAKTNSFYPKWILSGMLFQQDTLTQVLIPHSLLISMSVRTLTDIGTF